MNDDEWWQWLLKQPALFGLEAQGHIPTIERMLSEGASWEEIGRAILWDPATAEKHYGWHLEREKSRNG